MLPARDMMAEAEQIDEIVNELIRQRFRRYVRDFAPLEIPERPGFMINIEWAIIKQAFNTVLNPNRYLDDLLGRGLRIALGAPDPNSPETLRANILREQVERPGGQREPSRELRRNQQIRLRLVDKAVDHQTFSFLVIAFLARGCIGADTPARRRRINLVRVMVEILKACWAAYVLLVIRPLIRTLEQQSRRLA